MWRRVASWATIDDQARGEQRFLLQDRERSLGRGSKRRRLSGLHQRRSVPQARSFLGRFCLLFVAAVRAGWLVTAEKRSRTGLCRSR